MSEPRVIMAWDQGTTSSRCILFDGKGEVAAVAQREIAQIYPRHGWVEHDPVEIWNSQLAVSMEALERSGIAPDRVAAIGITNQRETVVAWNRTTGLPICNAVVWQCRRTSEYCDRLREEGFEHVVQEKTGLVIDAYFSATKIRWILDNIPGARSLAGEGKLLCGTVDSWLIWNLTGGRVHATDYTNASRTMLFDIHALRWDEELLAKFDIPRGVLPEVVKPSSAFFGYADERLFGRRIPVSGVAGDQQAALYGQRCRRPGDAKNTYGTGCFLLMNTGVKAVRSRHGLLTTIAAGGEGEMQYALEGSIFVGGSVIQWLRDELSMIGAAEESEACARSVPDNNGVYIVPAFVGLGTPYWNPYARGTIVGIDRSSGKNHVVRAALESMAYQTLDVLEAMEKDCGTPLVSLKADGGASNNDFLMQFQSDILQKPVVRPRITETTALGAAYLAGLQSGFWPNVEEIDKMAESGMNFTPAMAVAQRDRYVVEWHRAMDAALRWAVR